MTRQQKKLLFDMQSMAREVRDAVGEMHLTAYQEDRLMQLAVERMMMIIGEAAFQLKKLWPDVAKHLTNFDQIVSMRHILVHAYDQINAEIMWQTIEQDIPKLIDECEQLIRQ